MPPRGKLVRRVLSLASAALLVLFAVALALGAPFCPSAGFLGIPCPGCGLTRATMALLSGDVERALALHPLVLVATPAAFALVAYAASRTLARGPARPMSRRAAMTISSFAIALSVALIAVWLARFAGYFGGPVPVTTYAEWARSLKK